MELLVKRTVQLLFLITRCNLVERLWRSDVDSADGNLLVTGSELEFFGRECSSFRTTAMNWGKSGSFLAHLDDSRCSDVDEWF